MSDDQIKNLKEDIARQIEKSVKLHSNPLRNGNRKPTILYTILLTVITLLVTYNTSQSSKYHQIEMEEKKEIKIEIDKFNNVINDHLRTDDVRFTEKHIEIQAIDKRVSILETFHFPK